MGDFVCYYLLGIWKYRKSWERETKGEVTVEVLV